jgi:hypothetical protein
MESGLWEAALSGNRGKSRGFHTGYRKRSNVFFSSSSDAGRFPERPPAHFSLDKAGSACYFWQQITVNSKQRERRKSEISNTDADM